MKKFSAEMKVVRFGAEDMIVTSGKVVTLSNFTDVDKTNNTFSFGGNNYVIDPDSYDAFRKALAGYVGDAELGKQNGGVIKFGGREVNNIFKFQITDPDFDGEYTYDGIGLYTFSKKQ